MAYEEVHSPIITDETGQAILTKLNEIKQVLSTPADAEDINYDNTTSGMTADNVQDAVDELKSNLTDLITISDYTFTTNSSGGGVIDIDYTKFITALSPSGSVYYFRCRVSAQNKVAVEVRNSENALVANTSITAKVMHLPLT